MGLAVSRPLALLLILLGSTVLAVAQLRLSNLDSSEAQEPFHAQLGATKLYEQYVPHRTLSEEEIGGRLIVVGDVHAHYESLLRLLNKLDYDPDIDHLIVTGDLTTKGPVEGSLAVLADFARRNITAVRGNHDQQVIQWRGWIDHVLSKRKGRKWLEKKERKEEEDDEDDFEFGAKDDEVETFKKKWKKIPEDWKFMDKHYKVARAMSHAEAAYIRALPTVVHIPHLHAYVVHAGILPTDPRDPVSDEDQPLAHVPELKHEHGGVSEDELVLIKRRVQERDILYDIEQNRDHWVLQNIRSITDDGEVTKDMDDGTPWSDHWNDVMARCKGFDDDFTKEDAAAKLPCHPSTVIYGHAATRGLEPKRWTVGLDSGCTYGRRLTALVVGSTSDDDNLIHDREIPFGDDGTARLVSVSCEDEDD